MSSIDRRHFLAGSLALGVAGFAAPSFAATPRCGPAVPTGAGPYYPEGTIPEISDLVTLAGQSRTARGQFIEVVGTVTGRTCEPVAQAAVEIWQTDASGRYKHSRAEEQNVLDPHFSYFARVITDADGRYRFRTVMPKSYRFAGIHRASHIHFRIAHPEHGELITEMYFTGPKHDADRARDRVFRGRSKAAQQNLIIAPTQQTAVAAPPAYRFDLKLRG